MITQIGTRMIVPVAMLLPVDLFSPPGLSPESAVEALVEFLNAFKPGTSFELFSLNHSPSSEGARGRCLILRDELPAWEEAARVHGIRLQVSLEPLQPGEWDGGAKLEFHTHDQVLITLPL